MKSKDLQKAVKTQYKNGDGPAKIRPDLGGVVSKRTIKLWIKMINNTGSIKLSHSSGRPRIARTKANISKAKQRFDHNKRTSTRRLAVEIKISKTSAQRMLREDLDCFPYKKIKQPELINLQKQKRVKFADWAVNIYAKDDTKR